MEPSDFPGPHAHMRPCRGEGCFHLNLDYINVLLAPMNSFSTLQGTFGYRLKATYVPGSSNLHFDRLCDYRRSQPQEYASSPIEN